MKIISWVVFLVISMLGYNATTEAPTEVAPPTSTIASDPPRLRSKASNTTTTTTMAPTTTTTTEPVFGIEAARYPDLWITAVEAGWPTDRLPTLDLIAYHESRGQTDVVGTGAYGVLQIQWSAHKDWLTTELGVTEPKQLFDPLTNMVAALWLAEYAEEHYGCWAQPWYMSLNNPYKYCK
jgi:hypothetical protein